MQQSGELGTVGQKVLAAKQSQAQTLQEVDARFSPVFAEMLKKQEKLVSAANVLALKGEPGSVHNLRWFKLYMYTTDLETRTSFHDTPLLCTVW